MLIGVKNIKTDKMEWICSYVDSIDNVIYTYNHEKVLFYEIHADQDVYLFEANKYVIVFEQETA